MIKFEYRQASNLIDGRFGKVTQDGFYASENVPPQTIIEKAIEFINDYIAILDKHQVIPLDDSEQECLCFCLGMADNITFYLNIVFGCPKPNLDNKLSAESSISNSNIAILNTYSRICGNLVRVESDTIQV